MNQSDNYITKEKREGLEKELKDLKGLGRKEVLDALEYAKSLGDLSENAEYHQAREEQAKLEERIVRIEQVLQSSQVVSGGGGEDIEVGSKVVVVKQGDSEEKTYQIVGGEEADMREGKISNRSPFGKALFGKKKGEEVTVSTPKGVVNYKIIKVF
jgi:transcription elongation factor GreA